MSAIKNKFIRDVQSLKRKFKKTQVITDEDYNSVLKKVEQTEVTNNNFTFEHTHPFLYLFSKLLLYQ